MLVLINRYSRHSCDCRYYASEEDIDYFWRCVKLVAEDNKEVDYIVTSGRSQVCRENIINLIRKGV